MADIFDEKLRRIRRDRAVRQGPDLFLHERAFDDIMERLSFIKRRFRSALLIGALDARWRDRLLSCAESVDCVDAHALPSLTPGAYDLCVAVGELDTLNDLSHALLAVRFALREDSLFIGAIPGGDSLPALRAAMRAADEQMGVATPHVHPRIEPAGFTSLLTSAGFIMPVVDVDRVQVSYETLDDLVRDLRLMGATNILTARSRRPLTRSAAEAAAGHFRSNADGGRVTELFEIIHFAAWTPSLSSNG